MPEIRRQASPVVGGENVPGARLSPRAYNLTIAGLLFASFLVMGLSARWVTSPEATFAVARSIDAIGLGCLVGSIVGIVLMSFGKSRQSVPLSAVGFALFSLTFGFTLGLATAAYDVVTLNTALLATAGVVAVFGALGFAFPGFFAKIQRVCVAGLLGVILASVVMALLGVSQGILDWVTLILFCGFVGYDFYQAANDAPTLPNALWHTADIFLDIANILLSILDIVDND